jgi:glycosyltransferase involved in cell wall biosynthesis
MTRKNNIVVIIPAFNEERSISNVIREIPKERLQEVIVVNNASSDETARFARDAGATVINEYRRGYGSACLKGLAYVSSLNPLPEIVVFLDADYSDRPAEMVNLIRPILEGKADMVIGSRALGNRESGSMLPQQLFGNWLATRLIRIIYGVRFTDLGPFRAVRYHVLTGMDMTDTTYGWTVEMQIKAARMNIPVAEVPVSYKKRIGISKITGTLRGSVMAGYKIIYTIFRYSF